MNFWYPGWQSGNIWSNRVTLHPVAMPALPQHPGGPTAAAASPLDGLLAYGVPLQQTPNGMPILRAAPHSMGPSLPPWIPGMPQMPEPPSDFLGGRWAGGLFQPVLPVAPFDPNRRTQANEQAGNVSQEDSGVVS